MRLVAKVALILVVLAVIVFVARVWLITHGHIDERLDVTVRVIDSETGRPLSGAVVAVVRYRNMVEGDDLEWHLAEALKYSQQEDHWEVYRVGAVYTMGQPVIEVIATVYTTRWWLVGIRVSKEVYPPRILLIDHPKHGRTIIPIGPETPLTEGNEPNTWQLDLGTIRVP